MLPKLPCPSIRRNAHRPVLRHPCERIVDRTITVGVVVAHDIADDLGALAIGAASNEAPFLAGEQDATMHGFQSIANIRQSAADDHAHGVVEIARLHLVDDVDAVQSPRRSRGIEKVGFVSQWVAVSHKVARQLR